MTQDKSVTAKCIQEIRVGDTAYAAKTVTEADVMMFAMLSGDYAPQHVSAAFGATMSYHSRIAHGMLTVGLVGPVLNRLCGDASCTAYQKVHFSSAVLLNDTVYVKGTVTAVDPEKQRVTIEVTAARKEILEKIEAGTAQKGERPFLSAVFQQSLAV